MELRELHYKEVIAICNDAEGDFLLGVLRCRGYMQKNGDTLRELPDGTKCIAVDTPLVGQVSFFEDVLEGAISFKDLIIKDNEAGNSSFNKKEYENGQQSIWGFLSNVHLNSELNENGFTVPKLLSRGCFESAQYELLEEFNSESKLEIYVPETGIYGVYLGIHNEDDETYLVQMQGEANPKYVKKSTFELTGKLRGMTEFLREQKSRQPEDTEPTKFF